MGGGPTASGPSIDKPLEIAGGGPVEGCVEGGIVLDSLVDDAVDINQAYYVSSTCKKKKSC